MRPTILTSLAVLALACQVPCPAQGAPPSKTAAPQALTGPDGVDARVHPVSPATPPKKQDAPVAQAGSLKNEAKAPKEAHGTVAAPKGETPAEKEEKGRVGTLSPNEARRAARARERADAAQKTAPAHAARDESRGTSGPSSKPSVEAKTPQRAATVDAAPDRHPVQKHTGTVQARPRERAARPHEIDRPQTVTKTDVRHASTSANAPPRGIPSSGPAHAPRVGDVIPPGVPLYPQPPAYDVPPPRRSLASDPTRAPKVGDVIPPGVPLYPLPPPYDDGRP